ncbi:MAG: DUF3791 domain-containing protein [Proteobacteria bacterium]|nr:DUF3791 domain-containing protein [Pseudomonadota bacterium]
MNCNGNDTCKQIEWTVVCVNEFAKNFELTPRNAFHYLNAFGGIKFLMEHYVAEHMLSFDDAVDDLIFVCRQNGGGL